MNCYKRCWKIFNALAIAIGEVNSEKSLDAVPLTIKKQTTSIQVHCFIILCI